MAEESKALQLTNWLLDKGIDGVGPWKSAADLGDEYLSDTSYADNDERAWSLIKWETSKNVTSGFATGLGGLATLPVSIPLSFGASWLIQARLAASIARIHGHDLKNDKVRTLTLMCLLGDAGLKEPVKVAGVTFTRKMLLNGIKAIPRQTITRINQKIGMLLITKAGETGIINLAKLVPAVGGLVGVSFDGAMCYSVGAIAQKTFSPTPSGDPDRETAKPA